MCAPCTMQTHIITHPHIAHRVFTCALALVAAAGWAGAGAMTRRPIPQTGYIYPNNKSRRHPECANTFPSISGRPLTWPYMLYPPAFYTRRSPGLHFDDSEVKLKYPGAMCKRHGCVLLVQSFSAIVYKPMV